MNSNEQNNNNLDFLKQYRNYAIFAFFGVLIFFIFKSTGPGVTIHYEEKLGTVGDYFGGILNPVFAFLSFMALLATIKIQSNALKVSSDELINSRQELELTRGEIEKSRIAQEEQKEALESQQKEMVNQSFDNKFFQMLNLFNTTINNLQLKIAFRDDLLTKKEVLNHIRVKFESSLTTMEHDNFSNFQKIFNNYNNNFDTTFKYYFINLYQVLKYCKTYGDTLEETKEYTNILRAQLSKDELILLFYNGLGIIEFCQEDYKILIEKYSLFEHLKYEDLKSHQQNKIVDLLLTKYNETAFGNNQLLKNKRIELINEQTD